MIGFKQFLAEVFDRPVPYRKKSTINDDKGDTYTFVVDKNPYVVYIGRSRTLSGTTRFDLVLSHKNSVSSEFALSKLNKNQFIVLATTKKIITDYFDHQLLSRADTIKFDAFDSKSSNLYRKFAQFLANRYKMSLDIRPSDIFVLTKQ